MRRISGASLIDVDEDKGIKLLAGIRLVQIPRGDVVSPRRSGEQRMRGRQAEDFAIEEAFCNGDAAYGRCGRAVGAAQCSSRLRPLPLISPRSRVPGNSRITE